MFIPIVLFYFEWVFFFFFFLLYCILKHRIYHVNITYIYCAWWAYLEENVLWKIIKHCSTFKSHIMMNMLVWIFQKYKRWIIVTQCYFPIRKPTIPCGDWNPYQTMCMYDFWCLKWICLLTAGGRADSYLIQTRQQSKIKSNEDEISVSGLLFLPVLSE